MDRIIITPQCTRCSRLLTSRRQIVWGEWADGSPPRNTITGPGPRVLLVGETPGETEDRQGRPFFGTTGQEVRKMLWRVGLLGVTYITNIVKCRPPEDTDPEFTEIMQCGEWLRREMEIIQPTLVIAAGRFATRWFLELDDDEATMEMVTGIPYRIPGAPYTVLPMLHPAAGFRDQRSMAWVMEAFKVAGQVVNGQVKPRRLPTAPTSPDYVECESPDDLEFYLNSFYKSPVAYRPSGVIALDTEDGPDGRPWCVTISDEANTARLFRGDNRPVVDVFQQWITDTDPLLVIHSALYDLPELAKIGITPRRFVDTMVMAYLLQDEPLGLKPLAWRHANLKMRAYSEVVANANVAKALAYLESCMDRAWPDQPPILTYSKGSPSVKKPQNISKKIARILSDVGAGKTTKDGLIDPRKRWNAIGEDEGRGVVEEALGPMPKAYLCDVHYSDALTYACMDADATLRIYSHLSKRIAQEGMQPIVEDEVGVTRFVNMMAQGGIYCDRAHYEHLSAHFQQRMMEIEQQIVIATGCNVQLTSHQQVSSLLYDRDKLNLTQYLPKKLGKKAGKTKTGDDILAQLENHSEVVGMIRKHREYQKLDNTYAQGVPKFIRPDSKVYADFRTTNTDTGRLSCANPNWMAQPKRSEEGKGLRNGVIAPPGFYILSTDYSQIELRLTAHEANEQSMIKAFLDGIDLHSLTAAEMFFGFNPDGATVEEIEVATKKVDKNTQRLPAKTINFGIIYGLTASGLYRNMIKIKGCEHWTESLADKYIRMYFDRRPGITGYISETIDMARRHGKVWDWAGRYRIIPAIRLTNEYLRAEAERQACNARIQQGAQSIMKRGMKNLLPVYEEYRGRAKVKTFNPVTGEAVVMPVVSPMIQIHDDIVSYVHESVIEELVGIQKEVLETAHTLKTGVRVDAEWGVKWGELGEWITT